MALRSIRERKLRSVLTIVGIAIGIAAVVSLISTGIGATDFIKGQLNTLGANKIFISAATGGSFGPPSSSLRLTEKDADEISKIRGIDIASGLLSTSLPVKFGDQSASLSVTGSDPKINQKLFQDVQAFQLSAGRFLREGDGNSVVIGPVAASKVFSKNINVGDKLLISGRTFRVVGITEQSGQQFNDNLILVPLNSMREIIGEKDSLSFIIASVDDLNKLDETTKRVQDKLDQIHGKKVFSAITTTQLSTNISSIFNSLSVFLTGIAGISLIVAAVGISNTMLMSVLERTRQIGIMKAIGATNYNIVEIFLAESLLIGLFGGTVGVALGYVASQIINGATGAFGITFRTSVPLYLILGGIGLAVSVGVVSGLWPAVRAAKLKPIEALRYE